MKNFFDIFKFFLKIEWSNKEKFLASFILGLNVLIIFVFAFGEIESHVKQNAFFIAMLGIAMLFSCQAHLSRAWEQESQDHALAALGRAYGRYFRLYVAKFLSCFLLLIVINLPLLALATILLPHSFGFANINKIGVFMVLALFGGCSIGVLLAALVNKARSKQLLFTLIFFPLLTPVLVSFVFGALSLTAEDHAYLQWFQLLGLFDMLYFALGAALFCELMEVSG